MAFIPVDYGPQLHPDDEGFRELQAQQQRVLGSIQELGSTILGGSQQLVQGFLHTQSLKATAAVKERQASTLQFIDSNPYVDKSALQQKMSKEDFEAWSSTLAPEYADQDKVPMFTAAGALFDSEAKQARADAGQLITTPTWRSRWEATEQTESSTIRERYVNRLAADQMIADQRGQTLLAVDSMVDSATKPEDIDAAAKYAETSPWLKPAERRFTMEKTLVARDSFVARQAMLGGDTEVIQAELMKLRSDNAGDFYPHMNVKQRLDLANQLGREYTFKAVKGTADAIVGVNVDERGKVDRTAIAKALAAYKGPNPEEVTKAVKTEEAAKLDVFDKQMSEVQQTIKRAGFDPLTGRFSYAKAMQDPDARKAAYQLARDDIDKLTALSKEDQRWENIDSKANAAEQREAKAALVTASGQSLEQIHKDLDDPLQSDVFRRMTAAQFDVQLYNRGMTEPDRVKARAAFTAFQKNGGKPDERAEAIVKSEVSAAANGNSLKYKQLLAKYGDSLRVAAHAFIRSNSAMPPDQMNDALRGSIRSEMLSGKVVDSRAGGWLPDMTVRRIEWESNKEYLGRDFKLPDGTVIPSASQRIRLSKDGKTGTFAAGDVAGALADGWK